MANIADVSHRIQKKRIRPRCLRIYPTALIKNLKYLPCVGEKKVNYIHCPKGAGLGNIKLIEI